MVDLSRFNDWSKSLYQLGSGQPGRDELYFDDVSVQHADDVVNPEVERFNNKLELFKVLPYGWVVETLGSFVNGKFDGNLEDLDAYDVVVKPVNGTQGDNVRFVEAGVISQLIRNGDIPAGLNAVITRHYNRHHYSEEIKPGASNTIRMLTYVDDDGKAHNVASVHKWATDHSGFIDNWSKGGVTTWIADGMMMETIEDFSPISVRPGKGPHRKPINDKPYRYRYHPETGIQISGKIIPFWSDAEAMVLEASEIIAPGIQYAGWDVMITPLGPVLIEVNPWPGVQLIQAHVPLLGDLRFKEFLRSRGVDGV